MTLGTKPPAACKWDGGEGEANESEDPVSADNAACDHKASNTAVDRQLHPQWKAPNEVHRKRRYRMPNQTVMSSPAIWGRRVWGLVASPLAVLVMVLMMTACRSTNSGSAVSSPAALVARAVSAESRAESVRITGSFVASGTPFAVDLRLARSGGCDGSLSLRGMTVGVIRLGARLYVRGGARFDRDVLGIRDPSAVRGRWIEVGNSIGGLTEFAGLTSQRTFLRSITSGLGRAVLGKEQTFDGHRSIPIHDLSNGDILYVSAAGVPYPLGIVGTHPDSGTILFEDWNAKFTIEAPKNAILLFKT